MSVIPISPASPDTVGPGAGLPGATRAKTSAADAAALRRAAPADQRAAVAAQFEAILVRQLLGKTMNSMLGGAEGSVAGSIYGDMLADTLSQQLAAGRGLGLGRFIEQQLTPRGESPAAPDAESSASPAASSTFRTQTFKPESEVS
jgi:Rod binding domain-containing protein